mgnify:CR=1 FL=1
MARDIEEPLCRRCTKYIICKEVNPHLDRCTIKECKCYQDVKILEPHMYLKKGK